MREPKLTKEERMDERYRKVYEKEGIRGSAKWPPRVEGYEGKDNLEIAHDL